MRAVFVIVANVFRQQAFQMAFIHRNDVIQQVSSAAFDPTLRNSILPAAFERGSDGADLQSSNRYGDFQPIFPISIKDQKPWGRPKRKCLTQLLYYLKARRVPRDVEMQDTSAIVADDEKAIDYAECDRWDREEIHRSDGFPVITQKCQRWTSVERGTKSAQGREILAVGRLSKRPGSHDAEVAFLVRDQHQRQGLGTELLSRLIEIARSEHLERLLAFILVENTEMQSLVRKTKSRVTAIEDPSVFCASLELAGPANQ